MFKLNKTISVSYPIPQDALKVIGQKIRVV